MISIKNGLIVSNKNESINIFEDDIVTVKERDNTITGRIDQIDIDKNSFIIDNSKKYNIHKVSIFYSNVNGVTYKDKTILNGYTGVSKFIVKNIESNREIFAEDDIVNIKLKENIYGIIKIHDDNYIGRISYFDINNGSITLDTSTENNGSSKEINIDDIEDIKLNIF